MTPRPAPRTLLGVLLCLAALLVSGSALAQEVPVDSLPAEPVYEAEPAYDDGAAEGTDVAATLAADGRFTVLLGALAETGLDAALAGDGPFTVFAPTDSAFAALPEGALAALSADDLRTVLLYHVVEGDLDPEAGIVEPVATLAGPTLDLADVDGQLVINGTAAAGPAVAVSNGRVYAIGAVLLPPAADPGDGE